MSDIDVSALHEDAAFAVRMAIELGFRAEQDRVGTVILHAPHHPITLSVPPVRQWNRRKMDTLQRKIIKYADPVKRMTVAAALDPDEKGVDPTYDSPIFRAMLASVDPRLGDDGILHSDDPVNPLVPPSEPPAPEPPQESPDGARIVKSSPWLAAAGPATGNRPGRRYESEAVIERHWSDGSIDYVCSWPGCGFTHPSNPRAVASHYGGSKDHAKVGPQSPQYADPDYVEPITHHRSAQNRAARLARELALVIVDADGNLEAAAYDDPLEWARTVAERIVAARDANRLTRETESGEPMTPEELIERIRVIVDDGSYLRRIEAEATLIAERDNLAADLAELRDQVDRLSKDAVTDATTIGDLNAALMESQEGERRARERWEALRSLVEGE